jgi:acyl-CoA thioesterase I
MPTRRLVLALITTSLVALLAASEPPNARAEAAMPVLLVVGDSISAGYGLAKGSGWVDLLARRIEAQKLSWRVVNASISGDTTAGGRARLPGLLAQHKPAIVIVELGGNDGLRGGNLAATRDNLDAIIGAIKKAGAKPLLIGMRLPPNYGAAYVREFNAMYTTLAAAQKVPLVPFLFEGFGEKDEMFQSDRVHPAPAAQERMLDNVWPVLQPMLGGAR